MGIGLENINALWASLIIEELVRNGIEYACVSPGSRSTPLTIAAARNGKLKKRICYDERGAAYHALGYARATGKPALLICTSGTAAANYYPAIVEASMDHVPMIILSADRPPELLDTGANQTIHQQGMYGKYVRWQYELPCPDENLDPRMVLSTVDQLLHRATGDNPGPVHLNNMYREPLALKTEKVDDTCVQKLTDWMVNGTSAYTDYARSVKQLDSSFVKRISELINNAKSGVIIAGRMQSTDDIAAVRKLAKHLKWPVFADILSGNRIQQENTISFYDQMLAVEEVTEELNPDVVLHFGGQFVSKRLLQFIETKTPQYYIHTAGYAERIDPVHRVTHRLNADIASVCAALKSYTSVGNAEITTLEKLSAKALLAVNEILDETHKMTEPGIARATASGLPENWGLYLASSMPIRDMDMFVKSLPDNVRIAGNRGASGIDGTVASAAGFAEGLGKPVVLMIGDLALIHDMNSLDVVKKGAQPLVMVVINNKSGGIFHFLPVSQHKKVFEPWFTTPHNYAFEPLARQFNIPYMKCETLDIFKQELSKATQNKQTIILEIATRAEENHRFHQDILERIREVIKYR